MSRSSQYFRFRESAGKGILSARSSAPDLRELVDLGLLAVAQGIFQEASELFQKASELDPGNIMVCDTFKPTKTGERYFPPSKSFLLFGR